MQDENKTEEKPTGETPVVNTPPEVVSEVVKPAETTKEVSVTPPEQRNPEGKGGFGDHPENRSPGGWKKEENISYQYNLLIRMSVDEFLVWLNEHPEKDRTVAQEIAYNAVVSAKGNLDYLKEITDRTEGKAPQTISHEGGFFSTDAMKLIIVDERIETESEAGSDTPTTK